MCCVFVFSLLCDMLFDLLKKWKTTNTEICHKMSSQRKRKKRSFWNFIFVCEWIFTVFNIYENTTNVEKNLLYIWTLNGYVQGRPFWLKASLYSYTHTRARVSIVPARATNKLAENAAKPPRGRLCLRPALRLALLMSCRRATTTSRSSFLPVKREALCLLAFLYIKSTSSRSEEHTCESLSARHADEPDETAAPGALRGVG
jgi:hypothetical protein